MSIEQIKSQSRKPAPIDFGAMWAAIKKHRKLYYIALSVAFVVALIIGNSIPEIYTCQIRLAPEMGVKSSTSSLSSIAGSLGVNIGNSGSANGDAIVPQFYPELMNSVDFKTSLFPVKVKRKSDKAPKTLYDYLKNDWKYTWWDHFFGLMAPHKEKDTLVNNFELTGEQAMIAGMINQNISCNTDKKSSLITINVTAQDPHVAAQLADSVKTRLQQFLTKYRTNKARENLAFAETLQHQAKKDYERARRLYVEFMDANQDMVLLTARQKQIDLENEMQLQYNNYNALNAQVIAAKAKVQEETPAFTTLQSATVPLGPSSPNRGRIVLLWLFSAFVLTTIFVLYKEHLLRSLLGLS